MSLVLAATAAGASVPSDRSWQREVVYQIFERSFYDSNGDRIGDFDGIVEKLPYIKSLGATAILLQPIFKARMYHNYFADSFTETDPAFGGNRKFFNLVRQAHRNHLKVILDMEPQYVASEHPWYVEAKARPNSAAADRVLADAGYFGLLKLPTYNGQEVGINMVNLTDPAVASELKKIFKYWADPDGDRSAGVDGFRLDHMMDNLDDSPVDKNLFKDFWVPLESEIRKSFPEEFFVAEQSDWASVGEDYFRRGAVNAVYSIPLRGAFLDAIKDGRADPQLSAAIASENHATPEQETQLTIIEDHDVERFASVVSSDPALLRLGAAFQLALRGTPSIYYGQELGMKGTQLHGKDDGNDIPIRLAFRWSDKLEAKGTATWYGEGPWTRNRESADHDGISVQEEDRSPESLLNFYRKLIRIREANPALTVGSEEVFPSPDPALLTIRRISGTRQILAVFNFSNESKHASFEFHPSVGKDLVTGRSVNMKSGIEVSAHGFAYLESRAPRSR